MGIRDERNGEEEFKDFLDQQYNKELSSMETFSEETVEQINETYRKLWEEKREWLKKKEGQS